MKSDAPKDCWPAASCKSNAKSVSDSQIMLQVVRFFVLDVIVSNANWEEGG
jgi:hypothetical protein